MAAVRERTSVRTALRVPSRGPSFVVWTAKVEYVVRPPQKPVPSSASDEPDRPSATNIPSRNDPTTFTSRIPQGSRWSR